MHSVAVEALLRWQHPTRGLLHPGDFLDVAEGRPLIIPIGDWVLATAVDQADSWRRELGAQAPDMWVNISGDQLGRHHLDGVVEKLLVEDRTPAGRRSAWRSPNASSSDGPTPWLLTCGRCETSACRWQSTTSAPGTHRWTTCVSSPSTRSRSTDHSSAGLGRDRTDTAVTAAIIALGRSLDLIVVAEGVETATSIRSAS